MGIFDKLDGRADLMGQMAETVGVDFAEAIIKDPEMARTYRQAVRRCAHCKHDGECKSWMKEHAHAEETPEYCLNKDILEHLARP